MNKFFILIIIACPFLLAAQQDYTWKRQIQYSTAAEDIYICKDGGYLLTYNLYSQGQYIMGIIAKTDINGNILWEKEIHIYAIDGQETKNAIHNSIQDSAGNIYGIGSFYSYTSSYKNPFIFSN